MVLCDESFRAHPLKSSWKPAPKSHIWPSYATSLFFHKVAVTLWQTFSKIGFMSPNGSWVAFDYLQSIDSYSDPGGSFTSSWFSTQWPGEHQRTLHMEPSKKELAFQW